MSIRTVQLILPNGVRNANPFGVKDLVKTEQLDIDDIFFTSVKLSGSLKFEGDDFHHLYDWERSNRRCDKGTLIIREVCSGITKEVVRMVIDPEELEINVDRCSAILSINIETDIYKKYNEFKGIEYNLFDLFARRVVWHINNEGIVDPILFRVQNGLMLYDVISALLNKPYPGIDLRSSFFGWGEPQGATIGHSNLLTKMILAQTSDIYNRQYNLANPIPSPATILKSSLEPILKGICGMFDLRCEIEGNNIFRVEHNSYFDTITGPYNDAGSGKSGVLNNKLLTHYEHVNANRYSIETFSAKNVTKWLDFQGMPIEYDTCNSKNDTENRIDVPFTLDIDVPVSSSNEVDLLRGMFLGALNPTTDTLQELPPILDTYVVSGLFVNNLLGWSYLAADYHRSNKSYERAKINGAWTTVQQKRFKVQKGVKIYTCCNDSSIINGTIETALGEGRVMNTTKQFDKPFIEADVYFYDVPSLSIPVPTANDDWYYTLVNDPINTSSESLPSLIANDSGLLLSVIAETKSTIGGGTVTILSTGHFVYTPKFGFDGVDEFDYFLKDSIGNISTGTAFIAVRIPVVYIHKTEHTELIPGPPDTIAVTTDFEYFRDAAMLYPYDATNMNLQIFINAYDISLVNVYNYSFIAEGNQQRVPGALGEINDITEYTKDIQANSNYLQV